MPLQQLHGIGKQTANLFSRLQIYTVQDLLLHLPVRYQDRSQLSNMGHLMPDQEVIVEGVIQSVWQPKQGRTKLLCELKDETGRIYLRFFHVFSFQNHIFKEGTRLRCYGEIRLGNKGLEITHPEFQVIHPDKPLPIEPFLTAIYPTTEGLSQHLIRKFMQQALKIMHHQQLFAEIIPENLLQILQLPMLNAALQFLHQPPCTTSMQTLMDYQTVAQQRLIFEELLAHRLSLLQIKKMFQAHCSIPLEFKAMHVPIYLSKLPFQLTAAQQRVHAEIQQDLARTQPMLRLVQGDVSSRKTVIAALAMLQAIENNYQAAMMVPTELLAEQHYRNLQKAFSELGINVVMLSSHADNKKNILQMIENGEAQIIIGTHALFQEAVKFACLALVVIDEQHRFGVEQRALLRDKGVQQAYHPHQLIMTATPIPRTLTMSLYADFDCSIIDELPKGRVPITTSVLANHKREEVIERIRYACKENRQVYWVCPLIEESEVIHCQSALTAVTHLMQALPEYKIGLIHGRLKAIEKEMLMQQFKQAELNILVATTVIEVGVDVPNASVMIIENAERLGLSQLHQLRGRVGRGSIASHCVLLYQHPLSDFAKERLNVMRETTDGFRIAEKDLQLRGPGELLGTRQTGEMFFRIADLIRDNAWLPRIQQIAEVIEQQHTNLIELIINRWLNTQKESVY